MHKKLKKLGMVAMIPMMAMSLVGCSSQTTSNEAGANSVKAKIDIKDIAWNVDEGIVDGDRYVLLNYTNNSKYTIANFEITFKEKSDITEEEKNSFYSDIQKKFEVDDEDMQELKEKVISMHAETDKVVNPKESVSNVKSYYYSGSYYVKDMKHYQLMEPDIATIQYVDEDKIVTAYYDYSSKKYSVDSSIKTAYQWTQSQLGNKIPKPDVKIVESGSDSETYFSFDAYGMLLQQFEAYVEECKTLGYTVDQSSYEGYYSAKNNEGYSISLRYDEDDCKMDVMINAPKTNNEK